LLTCLVLPQNPHALPCPSHWRELECLKMFWTTTCKKNRPELCVLLPSCWRISPAQMTRPPLNLPPLHLPLHIFLIFPIKYFRVQVWIDPIGYAFKAGLWWLRRLGSPRGWAFPMLGCSDQGACNSNALSMGPGSVCPCEEGRPTRFVLERLLPPPSRPVLKEAMSLPYCLRSPCETYPGPRYLPQQFKCPPASYSHPACHFSCSCWPLLQHIFTWVCCTATTGITFHRSITNCFKVANIVVKSMTLECGRPKVVLLTKYGQQYCSTSVLTMLVLVKLQTIGLERTPCEFWKHQMSEPWMNRKWQCTCKLGQELPQIHKEVCIIQWETPGLLTPSSSSPWRTPGLKR
jgi:hypothetical protein